MKIAIDFDDTIVQTVPEVLNIVNAQRPQQYQYVMEDITSWMMTEHLDITLETLHTAFDAVDYNNCKVEDDCFSTIMALLDAGHDVQVVTANPNRAKIRAWMDSQPVLEHLPMHSVSNKVLYLTSTGFDIVIDDRFETCKGARKYGMASILFDRPWNQKETLVDWGIGNLERRVSRWYVIGNVIEDIVAGNPPPVGRLEIQQVADRLPEIRGEYYIRPDDIVTNENGAKQSRIEGRYDLLPPLAVKEIAKVLAEGAEKYGVDNWKGLSIDEVLNHVYAHLLDFQQSANLEDLSHAGCRILMALQLYMEAEDV